MNRLSNSPRQGLTAFNPEAAPFLPGAQAPETRLAPRAEDHEDALIGRALAAPLTADGLAEHLGRTRLSEALGPSPAGVCLEDAKYAGMSKNKKRKAKRGAERKAEQQSKKASRQLYVASAGPSGVFAGRPVAGQQPPVRHITQQMPGLGAHIPGLGNAYQQTLPRGQPPVATNAYQHHQPLDIFAGHFPPTAEAINATDGEVIQLINALPDLNAFRSLGPAMLDSETRPLTPDQVGGTRYGLGILGGIGAGTVWNPPAPAPGGPLRVRPRAHEGWGGWQWALENGWRWEGQGPMEQEEEPVPDPWSGAYPLLKTGWELDEDEK